MKKLVAVILFLGMFTTVVNAQEITMFSSFTGYKYYQDDEEIGKKELEKLFYKNQEIKKHWKKAKTQGIISGVALGAELGFALWWGAELGNENYTNDERYDKALAPALGVVGTGVVAAIFLYASNNSKKRAILTYNKQLDDKTVFRLMPTSNENGIGLALKF